MVILDTAVECTVKIRQSYPLVCLMFLGRQWSNSTVQNAWMFTHQNHLDIITQMEHTLGQVSLTCCLWYILSTDQKDQTTSLFQGCLDLKFHPWLTRYRREQQLREDGLHQHVQDPQNLITNKNKLFSILLFRFNIS